MCAVSEQWSSAWPRGEDRYHISICAIKAKWLLFCWTPCMQYQPWNTLYAISAMEHPLCNISHGTPCMQYQPWNTLYAISALEHPVCNIIRWTMQTEGNSETHDCVNICPAQAWITFMRNWGECGYSGNIYWTGKISHKGAFWVNWFMGMHVALLSLERK